MAVERPVRLVLDASLLLDPVYGGGTGEVAPALRPGAEALLRRLRYSNLGVVWALLLTCSCDLRLSVRIVCLPEVVAWCYWAVSGLVSMAYCIYRFWEFVHFFEHN
jgi:hypothetical protein